MDKQQFDSMSMEQQIEYMKLKAEIDILRKHIEYFKNSTSKLTPESSFKSVKIFEGDEVVRSFRINNDIQRKWKLFCRANPEHRVSDLINNALDEYMNNFNKK